MDLEARVRANIARRLQRRGAPAALAAKLSAHGQAWLSRYLSGELGMDLPTLEEIASVWHVSLHDIIGSDPLPDLTPEQAEGLAIAELWPKLSPEERRAYRTLIEGAATASESRTGSRPVAPAAAPETAPTRRRTGR